MRDAASSHEIVVCMGSACFARGNAAAVPVLQEFLQSKGLADAVKITGTLCQNQCRQGPNLSINGECLCGVETSALPELLEERMEGLLGSTGGILT